MQLFHIAENAQGIFRDANDESGFVVLMRICRDYVDDYKMPLLNGENRDKWLAERLTKYRIKYLEKI
jgi:hypothetical protein